MRVYGFCLFTPRTIESLLYGSSLRYPKSAAGLVVILPNKYLLQWGRKMVPVVEAEGELKRLNFHTEVGAQSRYDASN